MHKTYTDKPLTLKDVNEDIEKRIEKITDEFTKGFDFIKTYKQSVTFFGSAREEQGTENYEKARGIASRLVTELNFTVVTGGGNGIMAAANRGAYEAGGKSIGFTINLPHEQTTNQYLTDHIGFYYFFARKVCLTYSADAFIYFPGGYGTYDEIFEILTLVQTHKIERVPIILVDRAYWKNFDQYVRDNLVDKGKIDPEDKNLYTICDSIDEVVEIIKSVPIKQH